MSTSDFLAFVEEDSRLKTIKKAATRVLERIPRYYTDHRIGHSDRIIKSYLAPLLGLISGESAEGDQLNEHEMFILAASAYLHDIGMMSYPCEAGVYASETLRERHHELSYEIIMKSSNQKKINKETLDLGLHIEGTKEYADWIALVAKGHRKVDLWGPEYDERRRGGEDGARIRLKELAALLRLADQLDKDYRRVPHVQDLIQKWVPSESRIHWYPCHYVENVNTNNGLINFSFRFPQGGAEYVEPVCYLVKQSTKNCLAEVQEILFPLVPVALSERPRRVDFSQSKKSMPEEDFIRLLGEYLRQRSLGNLGTQHCAVGKTKEKDLREIAAISRAVWPDAPENETWYKRVRSEYKKYPEGFRVAKTSAGRVLGYTICFPVKHEYMERALNEELSVADMSGDAIEIRDSDDFWIEGIVLSPEANLFVAFSLISAMREILRSKISLRRIGAISMSVEGDRLASEIFQMDTKWTKVIGNECYKFHILEGERLERALKH